MASRIEARLRELKVALPEAVAGGDFRALRAGAVASCSIRR